MDILSKEFKEKIASELKMTDLGKDNNENVSITHNYLQMYIEIKHQELKLEKKLEEVYQELYSYYKYEYNKELKNNEIDLWVKADKKYKDWYKLYIQKKMESEYLEGIIKLFHNRGFAIKNAIEYLKLKEK